MNHQHHILHFLKNRELDELYISMALRSFAVSMIAVFIPIFLLQLGFSLVDVLIYYITVNLTHALFVIPAAKISTKYGIKHIIYLSNPLLIIFLILLFSLEMYSWPLILLGIIRGLNKGLFWVGYHTDFSKFSNRKQRGEQVGISKVLVAVASTIGPVFGGILITLTSFQTVFITVSILLLISALPLFLSKEIHQPTNFSLKQLFGSQKLKDGLAYAGHGVSTGVGYFLWPIFIFFNILNDYTALGAVTTLTFFLALLFTMVIAKLVNTNRKLILRLGVILDDVIWGIKFYVSAAFQVFIIDSFYGIAKTTTELPLDAISYDKANRDGNVIRHIMFREIMIQVGRTVLFIAMIFIADLTFSFAFAGAGSLLMLLF